MKFQKIAVSLAASSIALGLLGLAPAQAEETRPSGDIVVSPMWWNPEWDYRDTINSQMALIEGINETREAAGLPALKYSSSLNYVSHECLEVRAASGLEFSCYNFESSAMIPGWTSASQTTSFGPRAYEVLDSKLMKRSSERAKILNPDYTHIGVAVKPIDPLDKSRVQIVITYAAYPGGVTNEADEKLPPRMFPM